jgi:hypothetical protein
MIVEMRWLPEVWLWSWDIRSAPGGGLVESGWDSMWTAYPTPEEARAAGARRLAEMAPGVPAARRTRRVMVSLPERHRPARRAR